VTGDRGDSWSVAGGSGGHYPTQWSEPQIKPEPWMQEGLCTQTDPEIFFPDRGEPTKPGKKVCGQCGVREQCLAYALENGEVIGIWGGLSARQRKRLGLPRLRSASSRTEADERVLRLLVAENLTNTRIAERLGVSDQTVGKWRRELGLPGSHRRGRKAAIA